MARATRDKRILVRFITRSCSIQRAISLIGYRRCGRVGERNCSHLINREREKKDDRRGGVLGRKKKRGKGGGGGGFLKCFGSGGGFFFPLPGTKGGVFQRCEFRLAL